MMIRTFIAVDIIPAPALRNAYEYIRKQLRSERISWVPEGNMHLTLTFLGDTAEEALPGIFRILDGVAVKFHPFEIEIANAGVFKNLNDPRILWLGCNRCDSLGQIKKEQETSLSTLGFRAENRIFLPHLTLGRIKSACQPGLLQGVLSAYSGVVFQQQQIDRLLLYESRLMPGGAEYRVLKQFLLGER
ncbi:MAG: RNA 2',3'-cyclic phosphodiesterase [Bacteroidales bacterium]|nr:RNA 2',3'-cyclic phosphodiesterase [Bacteroidales bacterium]